MRTWSSNAIVAAVLWMVPAPSAGADAALHAQLPPAPPLVPDRSRPRQPLFPVPEVPQPRASVAQGSGPIPQIVCGMRIVPVNPSIDPRFVIPVPGEGAARRIPPADGAPSPPVQRPDTAPRYTMRQIVPPIPCR